MKSLNELLENLSVGDKKFYCCEIANWNNDQKTQLEELANLFLSVGAKNPISWAYSEITEDVPQLGRFLLLKHMHGIIKDTNGIIVEASEFDDDIQNKMNLISEVLGEELLNKMLYAYGKAILSGVISFIDEGNYSAKTDGISWHLCETTAKGESTGRVIQGLHEDFYDFE